MSFEDEGIVHSGFLISEFPEVDIITPNLNDKTRMEKFATQNVPVICRDNEKWGGFCSATKPYGNHRFLSNRTLANKYPYFQNVTENDMGSIGTGIETTLVNAPDNFSIVYNTYVYNSSASTKNPFKKYDKNAQYIEIDGSIVNNVFKEDDLVEPFKFCITLNNDIIDCAKGDYLCAAIVTDQIVKNLVTREITDSVTNTISHKIRLEPVEHSITFVELDKNGNELGRYEYPTPYKIVSNTEEYLSEKTFPSTNACKHYVNNRNTKSIMIIANICVPMAYGYSSDLYSDSVHLNAVLVEKNR